MPLINDRLRPFSESQLDNFCNFAFQFEINTELSIRCEIAMSLVSIEFKSEISLNENKMFVFFYWFV